MHPNSKVADYENIIANGFDLRRSRPGLLGQGIYFAAISSVSLRKFICSFKHKNKSSLLPADYAGNTNMMLLCNVVVGRVGNNHTTQGPVGDYDSVMDVHQRIFCVYEKYQAYPAYVRLMIYYTLLHILKLYPVNIL